MNLILYSEKRIYCWICNGCGQSHEVTAHGPSFCDVPYVIPNGWRADIQGVNVYGVITLYCADCSREQESA